MEAVTDSYHTPRVEPFKSRHSWKGRKMSRSPSSRQTYKRPSFIKLFLVSICILYLCDHLKQPNQVGNLVAEAKRQSRQHVAAPLNLDQSGDQDPMEPCYLANNRASESLTISESTPVGTIVGELMLNGDSSTNGNIELSIKMPGGQAATGVGASVGWPPDGQTSRLGASHPSAGQRKNTAYLSQHQQQQRVSASSQVGADENMQNDSLTPPAILPATTTRDLSQLIDLMPPLTIEQGTKRLILAKKLDRENLDRYIAAGGGYQTSANNAIGSSSASLTVHVKCQLREQVNLAASDTTTTTTKRQRNLESSSSIVIPIHLIVTDENDNWPIFVNSPYIIDLNESAQVGTLLVGNEIVATDLDQQGPFSTIEYSVVGGTLWSEAFTFLNPLDSNSLVVKDNRLLDYESQSKLALKIMARDQGEPPNWAISSLHVNLIDQDDQPPQFNEDKYQGYVRENRPGEQVDLLPRRMQARDGDKMIDSPVVYSFHVKTNQSIYFELDADLGSLRLKKTLPDELVVNKQPFCLLIRASQLDNPSRRWSLSAINVRMSRTPLAVDSASPGASKLEQLLTVGEPHLQLQSQPQVGGVQQVFRFQQSNYTLEVSESASVGFTVIDLRASLMTHSRFGYESQAKSILYQILDDSALGYFDIDPFSGRITLNRSLDYEMYRQLSFRVLATLEFEDPQSPSRLLCDIARVNVNIMNHNEFAPEFSHEQYNFQLSISDLIANFEQPVGETSSIEHNNLDGKKKRSAELVALDESDRVDAALNSPAMFLGRVYCADRDFGDRVSLQLQGSRANLFQLIPDGRLYLPLVDQSTPISGQQSSTTEQTIRRSGSPFWPHHSLKTFSGTNEQGPLDRKYLNYLLGELSNLGRLRLKVQASDDGRPQALQSSALVVISVISIDNFILQQGSQPNLSPPQSVAPTELQRQDDSSDPKSVESAQASTNQMMMIPSANGRDFVQINSDIIGNLLMTRDQSHHQRVGPQNAHESLSNRSDSFRQDPLQSAVGNSALAAAPSSGSNWYSASPSNGTSRLQPPSLLLVDSVGVKLVAMQAALEVYSKQVQDAALGQQVSQSKRRKSIQDAMNYGHLDWDPNGPTSTWARVKNYFGYRDDYSGTQWPSVLTVVSLHVVGLVLILGLIYKSRTMILLSETSNSLVHSDRRHGPSSFFSAFFDEQSSGNFQAASSSLGLVIDGHQAAAIPSHLSANLSSQSNTDNTNLSSSDNNSDSPNYSFVRRQKSTTHSHHRIRLRQSGSKKTGAAMTVAPTSLEQNFSTNLMIDHQSADPAQQQNALCQSRNTLKRILDDDKTNQGDILIDHQPLVEDYGHPLNQTNQCSPVLGSPSNLGSCPSPVNITSTTTTTTQQIGKSSTLISFSSPQTRNLTDSSKSNTVSQPAPKSTTTTLVINVKAAAKPPAPSPTNANTKDPQPLAVTKKSGSASNSSSFISLVSMSSSISDKINAAIEKPGLATKGAGSDSSSVDSASMFKALFESISPNGQPGSLSSSSGGQSSSSSASNGANAGQNQPPPAPPPPPPMPLSSMLHSPATSSSGSSTSLTNGRRNRNLARPAKATKPFSALVARKEEPPSNKCRPLPQNPVHVKLRQQARQASGINYGSRDQLDHPTKVGDEIISKGSPQVPPPSLSTASGRRFEYSRHPRGPQIPPPPSVTVTPKAQSNPSSFLAPQQVPGRASNTTTSTTAKAIGSVSRVKLPQTHSGSLAGRKQNGVRKSLTATRPVTPPPSMELHGPISECSLEDEDFYFCYTGPSSIPTSSGLLDEYFVHAYQRESTPEMSYPDDSGCHPQNILRHLQRSLGPNGGAGNYQTNNDLNYTNEDNLTMQQHQVSTNNQHVPSNHDLRSRTSQAIRRAHQRPVQNGNNGGTVQSTGRRRMSTMDDGRQTTHTNSSDHHRSYYQNQIPGHFDQATQNGMLSKKHLTWSDQVGVAR